MPFVDGAMRCSAYDALLTAIAVVREDVSRPG
jgi:hypothetical protein